MKKKQSLKTKADIFVTFLDLREAAKKSYFLVALSIRPYYRDRRVERHSNIYKPLGISDV